MVKKYKKILIFVGIALIIISLAIGGYILGNLTEKPTEIKFVFGGSTYDASDETYNALRESLFNYYSGCYIAQTIEVYDGDKLLKYCSRTYKIQNKLIETSSLTPYDFASVFKLDISELGRYDSEIQSAINSCDLDKIFTYDRKNSVFYVWLGSSYDESGDISYIPSEPVRFGLIKPINNGCNPNMN
jgi:hypothetical protein